jgi:uncharacterized protein
MVRCGPNCRGRLPFLSGRGTDSDWALRAPLYVHRVRPPADVERLREILAANEWFIGVLQAVRAVDPPDWLVGAGVIRNVVWDHLHGFASPTPVRDVDVAYFDASDTARERDHEIAGRLRARRPDVPWEVTNQAGVHLWYEAKFGFPIPPAPSVEDAIAMWPETATSVAVRLLPDDSLYVVAPCGLEDLLGLTLRRNPRQVSEAFFQQRLREKRPRDTWPLISVIAE